MIKASDAIKQALKTKQKNVESQFEGLLKEIEQDIRAEITGGGDLVTEIDVGDYDSEVVVLVAEHVRKYGWKTALHTKREVKIDGAKRDESLHTYLRVSCAHLEGKVELDAEE